MAKITLKKRKIGFNLEGVSFKNVIVRDVSLVDDFYFDKTVSSDDSKECVSFCDPIRMLFNQQRLNQLGPSAVTAWIDSMAKSKKDPLADLRSKCSDSDLKTLIKSRHIQQPSEIMAYAEYCKHNLDEFNSQIQEIIKKREWLEKQQEVVSELESGVQSITKTD